MTKGTKPMPNDNVDDEKVDDDFKLEDIDAELATPEQVTKVIKIAQSALVQRGKFKDQAIDPETGKPYKELLAEAQKPPVTIEKPPVTEQPTDLAATVADLKLSEEKRGFQDEHKLTRAETDMVYAQAKGMGIKPSEALETPFVKGGLKVLRDAQGASDATPRPSGRSPQVDGKLVKDMTEKEQRDNWPKITGAKT